MASYAYHKKRKRWYVSYKDTSGKPHRKFFKFKENAIEFWEYVAKAEERGRVGLENIEQIYFHEAVDLFIEDVLYLRSKTYQISESRRLKNILSYFEERFLCDVNQVLLEEFIKVRLKEGVSHKTVLNDLSILSVLFDWGISKKFTNDNPVKSVKKPSSLPRRKRRALSLEEVGKLLENACLCCYPGLFVLANTGIRVGELIGLEKKDFDFRWHVLRLQHQEENPLKGKSSRVIPLNDDLEDFVRSLPEGKILQVSRWTFEMHFQKLKKFTKVDVCLHELRHSYVTALVSSGVDLVTAKQITGHKDINTLQKYLHFSGARLAKIRNNVVFPVTNESQQKISEKKAL